MIIDNIEQSDISVIAEFQILMAKETEKKDLYLQEVIQSLQFFLNNSKYGFVISAKKDEKILGSLMVTYEYNQFEKSQSFWIQSVYVLKEFRNKGVFTSLFKFVENLAIQNQSSVKLYVETQNEIAQKRYQKLGLNILNVKFLEKDFYFNESLKKNNVQDYKFNFQLKNTFEQKVDFSKYKFFYNEQKLEDNYSHAQNLVIQIYEDQHTIGYCFIFQEFSDWRNGLIIYIYEIMLKDGSEFENVTQDLVQYIEQKMESDLKIVALRNIVKNQCTETIEKLQNLGFENSHYYLMAKNN